MYLARWPLTIQYKEKFENKSSHKVECAYRLIKHLLSCIIKETRSECAKCRPSIDQPIWANVATIAFVLEETLFNGKPINILFKEDHKSIYDDYLQVLNLVMIDDKQNMVNKDIEQYCVIDQLFQVLD